MKETKIVEEKQNHQIKKSSLSYRDLNFFSEDISWASIDADLLNTSWDILLTDVKTEEMYEIINICLEICKKHVLPKKGPRKHQIPRDRRALMRKILKLQKKTQRSNKSSNERKCTKSDQINWKQLKNLRKYRNKSKRNESYWCHQKNNKILVQICKKQLNGQSWNWTSPGWRGEPGDVQFQLWPLSCFLQIHRSILLFFWWHQ